MNCKEFLQQTSTIDGLPNKSTMEDIPFIIGDDIKSYKHCVKFDGI